MRKFLGNLVIFAIILAGVGFFRNWFEVSTEDQAGETNIEVTIDKDKIKQDAAAAAEKARGFASDGDEGDGRVREDGESVND